MPDKLLTHVIANKCKEPYECDPNYAVDEEVQAGASGVNMIKALRWHAMTQHVKMNYPSTLVLGFTEEDNFLLTTDGNGYLKVKDKISVQSIKRILKKYIRPERDPTSLIP